MYGVIGAVIVTVRSGVEGDRSTRKPKWPLLILVTLTWGQDYRGHP